MNMFLGEESHIQLGNSKAYAMALASLSLLY